MKAYLLICMIFGFGISASAVDWSTCQRAERNLIYCNNPKKNDAFYESKCTVEIVNHLKSLVKENCPFQKKADIDAITDEPVGAA